MRKDKARSIKYPSLWVVAATLCLVPVVASGTQPPDPINSDSNGNTAAGTDAMRNCCDVSGDDYAARYNTAIGYDALYHISDSSYGNTASGAYALYNNLYGGGNTAVGLNALYSSLYGKNNTALGADALHFSNADYAGDNTAVGTRALYHTTTSINNTASGSNALYNNITGSNNTALGYQTLYSSTNGSKNVAIGSGALNALTAGGGNIALGANAGSATTKGASNIYIGSPGLAGTESDAIRIGSAQTKTFIAGIADSPMAGATVVVKSNGRLGVVASSARYKQDIRPLDDTADKLAQLRPVSFRYKAEPEATHYGLIAEEVDAVMPELVVRDGENRPESVQYRELIPLLLQQWKAQREMIAQQHAELAQQKAELAALRRTLATRLAARGDDGLK
jgi:hypothetical protein